MKANKYIPIITGEENFQDRIDEIESGTSYDEVKHCVADLKQVLYANPEVPALCAPQIGKKLRLFVVRTAREESERFKIFLNPLVVSVEGLHLSREVNPSFPEKQFIIPRRNKIHVAYQKENGEPNSESFLGAYGEVVQQMIEMLDGITLFDYGFDLDEVGGYKKFDRAKNDEKSQVISMYLDTLKEYSADMQKEIEESPELKNLDDTMKFMTGMLTGDIKPINPVKYNPETGKTEPVEIKPKEDIK